MRVILPAGLWAVLAVSGVGAATAQTHADTVFVMTRTRDQLDSLLHAYGPTVNMKFYRNANDPFEIEGVFNKHLRYAERLEIQINVTPKNTIGLRVYPTWSGDRINIDEVPRSNDLARQLLRFSASSFFSWGVDDALYVFARFTFTLESGFPADAIKIVLRSIPLLDDSVGDMTPFFE